MHFMPHWEKFIPGTVLKLSKYAFYIVVIDNSYRVLLTEFIIMHFMSFWEIIHTGYC